MTFDEILEQLITLIYQRGLPPQATYTFKHALIQDAAYESLLKSTRQQYHQRIAQVLEEPFAEIVETQPELLAHHFTAARLYEKTVDYWHKAGKRAIERSANVEVIGHLNKGLELRQVDNPIFLIESCFALGVNTFWSGDFVLVERRTKGKLKRMA